LRHASRIIDCLEDDYLGVLGLTSDWTPRNGIDTLKKAFQALVEILNADATTELPPEEAAVCSEAFGRVVSSYNHIIYMSRPDLGKGVYDFQDTSDYDDDDEPRPRMECWLGRDDTDETDVGLVRGDR